MLELTENIFKTEKDPEQIPINKKSLHKLLRLHPKAPTYLLNKKGGLMGWVVVVPTNKKLAGNFLNLKISEKELFEKTKPLKKYSAIYLCSAIVLPRYRRKGYATEMFIKAINNIPKEKNVLFFYWPFNKSGKKLENILGLKLKKEKN